MTAALARREAIDGTLTEVGGMPHLLGSRCVDCGSFYFPRVGGYCRNPDCDSEQFEDVALSRTGRLWSFTNAGYQPPPPYIADSDSFEAFGIAAVELEAEQMIVLGQLASDVPLSALEVGMEMELVVERLYADDAGEAVTWKWRPRVAHAGATTEASV